MDLYVRPVDWLELAALETVDRDDTQIARVTDNTTKIRERRRGP